jgi:DNA-binding HxlR family transcriptional regulator
MPKRYGQACPVARSLEVIGERWTLLIVRDLLAGPRRFQDFQASLRGIAPNLLSERLKLMEEYGLVSRRFYSEHPPRAEYVLTQKGKELGHVVGALAVWGSHHLYRQAAVVHEGCGEAIRIAYYCPKCQGRVRGNAVKLTRRPRSSSRPRARRPSGGRPETTAGPPAPPRGRSRPGGRPTGS